MARDGWPSVQSTPWGHRAAYRHVQRLPLRLTPVRPPPPTQTDERSSGGSPRRTAGRRCRSRCKTCARTTTGQSIAATNSLKVKGCSAAVGGSGSCTSSRSPSAAGAGSAGHPAPRHMRAQPCHHRAAPAACHGCLRRCGESERVFLPDQPARADAEPPSAAVRPDQSLVPLRRRELGVRGDCWDGQTQAVGDRSRGPAEHVHRRMVAPAVRVAPGPRPRSTRCGRRLPAPCRRPPRPSVRKRHLGPGPHLDLGASNDRGKLQGASATPYGTQSVRSPEQPRKARVHRRRGPPACGTP